MRETARIGRIMASFQRIWYKYPDQRFGQLYMNLVREYKIKQGVTLNENFNRFPNIVWMIEDVDFEKFLNEFNGFETHDN